MVHALGPPAFNVVTAMLDRVRGRSVRCGQPIVFTLTARPFVADAMLGCVHGINAQCSLTATFTLVATQLLGYEAQSNRTNNRFVCLR